jgi:hypothetical protein
MRRHGLIWLMAITLILLFSPLFVGPGGYSRCLEVEMSAAETWYGPKELSKVVSTGKSLYGLLMVDTGLDPILRKHFAKPVPESHEIAPDVKLPDAVAEKADSFLGYWAGLMANIYLLCWRLAQIWLWFLYLTPFLAAIVFDALMTRRIKIDSFRYSSPTLYNASWHLMIGGAAAMLLYCCMSVPISIYWYPTAIALIGALARVLIGNIQHSA